MPAARTAAHARAAIASGRGVRRGRMPAQREPIGAIRDFTAALRTVIGRAHAAMLRSLATDKFPAMLARGEQARAHASIERAYEAAVATITPAAIARVVVVHGAQAAAHHKRELERQLAAALGAPVRVGPTLPGRLAERSDPTLRAIKRYLDELRRALDKATASAFDGAAFRYDDTDATGSTCCAVHADVLDSEFPIEHARAHAELIGGLTSDEKDSLAQFVSQLHAEGSLSNRQRRDVETFLEERLGMGQRRAHLVARDQIAKLVGQINMDRQVALGITHYEWDTRRDNRVRPQHKKQRRKIYAWSKPPPGGHPGMPPLCRCNARPVVTNIIAILGERPRGPTVAFEP